jgi:hypothetical protein
MVKSDQIETVFDCRPERVTIFSLRSTMAGYEHGDTSCWDDNWKNLVNESGIPCACAVTGCLQYFVRSLRATSIKTLQFFPVSCRKLSGDECLALSLLSGHQHGDESTIKYCLDLMLRDDGNAFVLELNDAAAQLSQQLQAFDLILLPVPVNIIASIVPKNCATCPRICNLLH